MRSVPRFATADIEANDWTKFLVMGFFDGEDYHRFLSVKSFIRFLTKGKLYNNWRIYFHNGGRYDFLFLIDVLYDEGFELRFINRGSGIIAMECRKPEFKIVFADSYALFPRSLDTLQHDYDSTYQKVPVDFSVSHRANEKSLNEHLENDCKGLYDIIQMEFNVTGLLQLTRASQAMAVFERDYLLDEIYSVSPEMDAYFRERYYHGGRVEVYKVFDKHLNYYDVNSLYPFAMLYPMPQGEPVNVRMRHPGTIGFYEVEIRSDMEQLISPLIHASKFGNYYFKGRKGDRTFVSSSDLDTLSYLGSKVNILHGFEFKQAEGLFDGFVKKYFEEKQRETGAKKAIAKLMLNSLYGKFGQRLQQDSIETYHGQNYTSIVNAEYDLVLVPGRIKKRYNGIYLAAWITSVARNYHYRLMLDSGFEKMVYCDTDSLITSAFLKTSDTLGGLKLEDSINKGIFLAPKTYAYINDKGDEVVKVKGFNNKDFHFQDLKNLVKEKGSIITSKREGVASFRVASGIIREGKKIIRKKGIVRTETYWLKKIIEEKNLTFDYTRRKLVNDTIHIYKTIPLTRKEIFNDEK